MRTIIESDLFRAQCVQLLKDERRIDELLRAVTWALANRPDLFDFVDQERNLRLVKGVRSVPFRIWYRATEHEVELLAIEPYDLQE